ncbi:hypothetical protein JCM10212_003221 [Sporobolomyces blumeae]
MLSTPLQPFVFPPVSTSLNDDPAPLPTPIARPTSSSTSHRKHRHSDKVQRAIDLLRTLADQAVRPVEARSPVDEPRLGVIASLESHGWSHQTTKNGIRIFQLESDADAFAPPPTPNNAAPRATTTATTTSGLERVRSVAMTASPRNDPVTSPGMSSITTSRRGIRKDEVLPFFRGEGWIEGSWRKEDVAATISSFGARAVWDPRFDGMHSRVVELLNDTDSLSHMHIRGFLVADRDACMVSTHAEDEREGNENVLYVAACSVDDPLVPKSGVRTTVHLNGFAIRSLPQAPHYEPPPPPQSATPGSLPIDLPSVRPSHRRTKSSMSIVHATNAANSNFLMPHPPLPSSNPFKSVSAPLHPPPPPPPPPRPPPPQQTLSSSTFATSSNGPSSSSEAAFPFPLTFKSSVEPPAAETRRSSVPQASSNRPGLALSMLIRASPGYNLPHSMIQQLSVFLPLSIASIGRFLASHGFAPHLVRVGSACRLREEEFDAASGRYRVVVTPVSRRPGPTDGDMETGEVRIRFHGSTFGGRFDVEVKHVRPEGWRIDYDVPPAKAGDVLFEKTEEELGGPGSGRWSTSLTIEGARSPDGRPHARTRFEDSPSLNSPGEASFPDAYADPALLPGPLGGCTLVIDVSATTPHLPVVVTITRPCSDSSSQPLKKMRGMSKALAQASRVALEDHSTLCDSLEEFLECAREGDERAEMCLKGARTILRELERAKEQEAEKASQIRLMSSALFGGGAVATSSRGPHSSSSTASPRSPPSRLLASPKKLNRTTSSLSLRFGIP